MKVENLSVSPVPKTFHESFDVTVDGQRCRGYLISHDNFEDDEIIFHYRGSTFRWKRNEYINFDGDLCGFIKMKLEA